MFYTKYGKTFEQTVLDELLFGDNELSWTHIDRVRGTVTRWTDTVPFDFDTQSAINHLILFNKTFSELEASNKESLYRSFKIPKHSGGYRNIDAPNDTLMLALRTLAKLLKNDFNALHHTAAYAYVEGRCPVDAVRKHQSFGSNWFLKTDFSNFFGSITLNFTLEILKLIFPFNLVLSDPIGKDELTKALSLCFLNGGLPQGTPISPMLTNLIMIPIDHYLNNELSQRAFVYTRYADDITISAIENFNKNTVLKIIDDAIRKYNAPFVLNHKKTRYAAKAGPNWNLGVMLNKDNQITVGHKKKKYFKAALCSFIMDYKNNIQWDPGDVMELSGTISYYRSVEKDYFDHIIDHYNEKFGTDIMKILREAMHNN